MKLHISYYQVHGALALTEAQLRILSKCAKEHYDGLCKDQARMFANLAEVVKEEPDYMVSVTTQELDLWLKVTEQLCGKQSSEVLHLHLQFHAAFDILQKLAATAKEAVEAVAHYAL